MDYKSLKEFLHVGEEKDLILPSRIFDLFKSNINSNHISFAYSYYFLISYLYEFTKYGRHLYNHEDIKEILGYNRKTKGIDYLIKKNGLMDTLGYTNTSKDFPVSYEVKQGEKIFNMFSNKVKDDQDTKEIVSSRKYNIKIPNIKIDIENNYPVSIETFIFCLGHSSLGCNAFYLYSYLKCLNNMNKYNISLDKLSRMTCLSKSTLKRTLHELKSHNLITYKINQKYKHNLPENERIPNSYYVNEPNCFTVNKIPYDKVEISEWHLEWQKRFSDNEREITLYKDGHEHRADVCLTKSNREKIILELQKSIISSKDIIKRCNFYKQFGKLIWLFDLTDKNIIKNEESKDMISYKWSYPSKAIPIPSYFQKVGVIIALQISKEQIVLPFATKESKWNEFYCKKKDIINPAQFKEYIHSL